MWIKKHWKYLLHEQWIIMHNSYLTNSKQDFKQRLFIGCEH